MAGEGGEALKLADWAGIVGAVAGVLSFVIAVVAWLAPSPRDVAEDLKDDPDYRRTTAVRLRGATAGTVYRDMLAGGLAFLERAMGSPGSAKALGVSVLLAIIYAWATFVLPWGLGAPGTVGGYLLFGDAAQPARVAVAATLVLLPLLLYRVGATLGRRVGRAERRYKLVLRLHLQHKTRKITWHNFELAYRLLSSVAFGAALAAFAFSGVFGDFGEILAPLLIFGTVPMLGALAGTWAAARFRHYLGGAIAAIVGGTVAAGVWTLAEAGAQLGGEAEVVAVAVAVAVIGPGAVLAVGAGILLGTGAGTAVIGGTTAIAGAGGLAAVVMAMTLIAALGTGRAAMESKIRNRALTQNVLSANIGAIVGISSAADGLWDEEGLRAQLFYFLFFSFLFSR